MSNNKNILLISYIFPPAAGIGGRRWAKFAKYLSRQGYVVQVITAENYSDSVSEWLKDIDEPNIKVHLLPMKYPSVLNRIPNTLFEKLKYRFWMYFFKIFSKGTIFDRSVFWKYQLMKKTESLINEFKIKNVIVTIPPFKLAHHCISIKNKYPNINLIVDYRDPWTDNKSFHGFKGLSKTRLSYEISIENEVLRAADKVISVSQEMSQKLISRDITSSSKFFTISNGFDEEDIIFSNRIKKSNEGYFTFIYTGSLYSNLDYVIEPLLDFLVNLKQNNKKLFNKLRFEFYGNQDIQLANKIKEANLNIIKVFSQVSLITVYQKINEANFCLLFSAPDHSFAFNTKFFEYLACRKPILLFSNLGKTSEFISQNNLGYTIDNSDFKNSIEEILIKITNNSFNYNSEFDIRPFSVKTMTKDLDHLLC